MATPLLAFAGLIGLAVGSYLSLLTYRLARGEPTFAGRSRCPSCGRTLSWIELVPLASFLSQGGRCRSCRAPISLRYPFLELTAGGLFFAVAWGVSSGVLPPPAALGGAPLALAGWGALLASFLYYAILATFGLAISVSDIEQGLIPRVLLLPILAAGALDKAAAAAWRQDPGILLATAAVALAAFAFFWGLWRSSRGQAMGRGDADLAFTLAVFLGPRLTAPAVLSAFWLGALSGTILIAAGKAGWKSQLPLAPFLIGGSLLTLFAEAALRRLLPMTSYYGL